MTDSDYEDWDSSHDWLRAKAKDVHSLSESQIKQIDAQIAKQIKERIEGEAAQRWWLLFGLHGHRLDTLEDELQFITHLDTVFKHPLASKLISECSTARQQYRSFHFTKRGKFVRNLFLAPSLPRLLELMLFGYFDFDGSWIYLDRSTRRTPQGFERPKQWRVVLDSAQLTDRLGIRIEIAVIGGRIRSTTPGKLFSNLPPHEKEKLMVSYGDVGTTEEWIEGMIESLFMESGRRSAITIHFAGESELPGITLAEFVANGEHLPGKKVVALNGDLLDCRKENLTTKSSRGRTMACRTCRMPTTKDDSEIIKDTGGSSLRVCHSCLRWMAKGT